MGLLKILASYRFSRYIKIGVLLSDLILLNFCYLLSFYIRFGNFNRLNLQEPKTIFLLLNIFWLILIVHFESYKIIRNERIEKVISKSIKVLFYHSILILLIIISLKYLDISRMRMLIFYLLFSSSIIFSRFLLLKSLKIVRAKGYNYRNIVIFGNNEIGNKIHNILISDLTYGYKIKGVFSSDSESNISLFSNYLGKFNNFEKYIKTNNIDVVYIALNHYDKEIINGIIKICEQNLVRINFIPEFGSYTKSRRVNISFYDNLPILAFRKEPLEIPINRLSKKIFDITFSLFIIFFIFPWLIPILILLVKFSSKGPVFFKQKRTGEGQNDFYCYKFRTMKVNKLSDEIQATLNDNRITKIGLLLRKLNLDELPQFFNVLIGQMSVVGPRPHMLKHTEDYSKLLDNYAVRHLSKPGITGWAQVNGFRGEIKKIEDLKNRIEYDIWYIENWTFLLDIKIVFLTVIKMFKGDKNAY